MKTKSVPFAFVDKKCFSDVTCEDHWIAPLLYKYVPQLVL